MGALLGWVQGLELMVSIFMKYIRKFVKNMLVLYQRYFVHIRTNWPCAKLKPLAAVHRKRYQLIS